MKLLESNYATLNLFYRRRWKNTCESFIFNRKNLVDSITHSRLMTRRTIRDYDDDYTRRQFSTH